MSSSQPGRISYIQQRILYPKPALSLSKAAEAMCKLKLRATEKGTCLPIPACCQLVTGSLLAQTTLGQRCSSYSRELPHAEARCSLPSFKDLNRHQFFISYQLPHPGIGFHMKAAVSITIASVTVH